jgi:hypothetical protein
MCARTEIKGLYDVIMEALDLDWGFIEGFSTKICVISKNFKLWVC